MTLAELWNGGKLKLSEYEGLHTAIQKRADRVLKMTCDGNGRETERSESEQKEIMALLLDLVEVAPDGDYGGHYADDDAWTPCSLAAVPNGDP